MKGGGRVVGGSVEVVWGDVGVVEVSVGITLGGVGIVWRVFWVAIGSTRAVILEV